MRSFFRGVAYFRTHKSFGPTTVETSVRACLAPTRVPGTNERAWHQRACLAPTSVPGTKSANERAWHQRACLAPSPRTSVPGTKSAKRTQCAWHRVNGVFAQCAWHQVRVRVCLAPSETLIVSSMFSSFPRNIVVDSLKQTCKWKLALHW